MSYLSSNCDLFPFPFDCLVPRGGGADRIVVVKARGNDRGEDRSVTYLSFNGSIDYEGETWMLTSLEKMKKEEENRRLKNMRSKRMEQRANGTNPTLNREKQGENVIVTASDTALAHKVNKQTINWLTWNLAGYYCKALRRRRHGSSDEIDRCS